jgi:ABC-type polysaccharide/polyol phosphate export permease
MASEDIRSRYARTALGPIWNVIGIGVFIAALAVTFGAIFKQPTHEFVPYLAASMAIWNCLSTLVVEAPSVFPRSAGVITVFSLPISIHVHRLVIEKLILLFHYLIIFAVASVVFKRMPTVAIALFPLALLIYYVFGVGFALLLGVLGVRFRDVNPAVAAIMTMLLIVTPVFWEKKTIQAQPWIADFNPMYHLLEIGRGPLLGYYPDLSHWVAAGFISFGALAAGLLAFANGRRTILYWI